MSDKSSEIMEGVARLAAGAAGPAVPAPEITRQAEQTLELLPDALEGNNPRLLERWEAIGRRYAELELAMSEIPDTPEVLKHAVWSVMQERVSAGAVELADLVDAMMDVEKVLGDCWTAMILGFLGSRDTAVTAQAERVAAMYALTDVLSTEGDRFDVYRAIVNQVAAITGITRCSLLVFEDTGNLVPAASNFSNAFEMLMSLPADELAALEAAGALGGPTVLKRGDRNPALVESLLTHYHTPVLLVIPVRTPERRLGLLLLDMEKEGEFTGEQIELAAACAGQAAMAIDRIGLLSEIETRLKHMAAIGIVARSLGTYMAPGEQMDGLLDMACVLVRADSGVLLLAEEMFGELKLEAHTGTFDWATGSDFQGVARWVLNNGELVLWRKGIGDPRFVELDLPVQAVLAAPLKVRDKGIGVIAVASSGPGETYSAEDLQMFDNFSAQVAVSIENTQLYDRLQDTYLGAIGALAAAIEARDPYTVGHSARVTQYAVAIAQSMGLATEEVEDLRLAGLLHDLGKIGIPDSILNKPGRLSEEEYSAIKMHPALSMRIIEPLPQLGNIIPIIYHHHERFDGHGYIEGKAGETIPLGARIIAVADSYEAMTSDRPYRSALTREQAMAELERCSGTQFDPLVVKHFMELLQSTVA
ncbi:MAG: GAF domain-containing protein [Actinobacteria bacterium]|nr:GAF domain-containing protein [Actinomycetota bacterium]